jgi:hypothetical protein
MLVSLAALYQIINGAARMLDAPNDLGLQRNIRLFAYHKMEEIWDVRYWQLS